MSPLSRKLRLSHLEKCGNDLFSQQSLDLHDFPAFVGYCICIQVCFEFFMSLSTMRSTELHVCLCLSTHNLDCQKNSSHDHFSQMVFFFSFGSRVFLTEHLFVPPLHKGGSYSCSDWPHSKVK